jgi:hypothetical protein
MIWLASWSILELSMLMYDSVGQGKHAPALSHITIMPEAAALQHGVNINETTQMCMLTFNAHYFKLLSWDRLLQARVLRSVEWFRYDRFPVLDDLRGNTTLSMASALLLDSLQPAKHQ